MSHPHSEQLFARDRHPESRDITLNPETAPGMNPPATQLKASALGAEESAVVQQKEAEQKQHAEKPGQNPPPFTPPTEAPLNPNSGGAGAGGGAGWMAKMEASFGTSFGDVKMNTNSQEAQAIQAKAFARGNEVHFAPGQFNPETQGGQELMGHELAHIVQQRQGRVQANATHAKGLAVNDDRGLEDEADRMGRLAAAGQSVSAHMRGAKAGIGANVTQGAFTSSVSLSRAIKEGEEEKKVGSDQVKVTGLTIPEKKRQQTRHGGNKQGHHSLAWTFLVKSYQQLATKKLPVQTFLESYLIPDYEDLKKQMTYGDEKVEIDLKLLDEMKKGSRTPSEWRKLIANLMQNYMRIHQLAPFATATKTFGKPGGEGKLKSSLEDYSARKVQMMAEEKNTEVISVDEVLIKMSGALEDLHMLLVDPLFQKNPTKAIQFLKKEWINTMKRAYPELWEKMELADEDLEGTVDAFFKKEYVLGPINELNNIDMAPREYEYGNHNAHINFNSNPPKNSDKKVEGALKKIGKGNLTEVDTEKIKKLSKMNFITTPILNIVEWVNDIFQDQKNDPNPELTPLKKEEKKSKEETMKEEDFFQELNSQFSVTVNLREENGIKSPMGAYTMNQLNMSNERPDTQYGTTQNSHTVAWALIRESFETLGQQGQSLEDFFITLQTDALKLLDALSDVDALVTGSSEKKDMDNDVKTPLKEVAETIQGLLNKKSETLKTDGEWEEETSTLLTKYVVAMHHSPTTTMGKKPAGRGEASAKGNLYDAENTLYDLKNGVSTKEKKPVWKVIRDDLKTMLDLEKSKLSKSIKGKPFVYIAYEWETHIKRAFPLVYKEFKTEIQKITESLAGEADEMEGYDNQTDYLNELRSGSKIEEYKKSYLPKEEKMEIMIEKKELENKEIDLKDIFPTEEIEMGEESKKPVNPFLTNSNDEQIIIDNEEDEKSISLEDSEEFEEENVNEDFDRKKEKRVDEPSEFETIKKKSKVEKELGVFDSQSKVVSNVGNSNPPPKFKIKKRKKKFTGSLKNSTSSINFIPKGNEDKDDHMVFN